LGEDTAFLVEQQQLMVGGKNSLVILEKLLVESSCFRLLEGTTSVELERTGFGIQLECVVVRIVPSLVRIVPWLGDKSLLVL
jgi:hypothetical protein